MPAAKKRTNTQISAAPRDKTDVPADEAGIHPNGDAVKKSKLEENTNEAVHRTQMIMEPDEGAMEMETGDSDEERFISKDEIGGLTSEELAQIEEDKRLMEEMGFPTRFSSTKGKHVEGNNVYVAHKVKVRKVRQLINKKAKPGAPNRSTPQQ